MYHLAKKYKKLCSFNLTPSLCNVYKKERPLFIPLVKFLSFKK